MSDINWIPEANSFCEGKLQMLHQQERKIKSAFTLDLPFWEHHLPGCFRQ